MKVYSLLVCSYVCSDCKILTNCEQKQKMTAVEGTLTTKLLRPPLKKKNLRVVKSLSVYCCFNGFSKIMVKFTQDETMKAQRA